MESSKLWDLVSNEKRITGHPSAKQLIRVIEGKTDRMPSGYPYICEASFIRFIRFTPHLFADGWSILKWVADLAPFIEQITDREERESMVRAIKVVRNMVQTAAITAPSDLWLARQILSTYKELGVLDLLLDDEVIDPDHFAAKHGLNARLLKVDFHFLYARGLLEYEPPCFIAPLDPASQTVLRKIETLPEQFRMDWVKPWMRLFSGDEAEWAQARQWLAFSGDRTRANMAWAPTHEEIEMGYRILPMILAIRGLDLADQLKQGEKPEKTLAFFPDEAARLFERAGLMENGLATALGDRVFKRGPGPFGIIGAYYPYLNLHHKILTSDKEKVWVSRGENVAASQDANRKTFKMANHALDAFCHDTHFRYSIFIEHAVGKGEAIRQRYNHDGETDIRYFGADLENAAIDQAVAEQKKGVLPRNMEFIRSADIGRPEKIVDYLKQAGLDTHGAVMMVGNGFHEIRDQTNEKMVAVLKGYREAGILILFTEETGLTDADLRATAWNTYHAGFRHVHEMSGQGLRPAWNSAYRQKIWSWRRCALKAGYVILNKYTHGTRPIYPIKKKGRDNPSISVTYFCVPRSLARDLNLESDDQTGE